MNNKFYPKISVVTPSYNQGHFIKQTILSVLGQGYPNLEYLIIDGGSKDETVEIIKEHELQLSYWISEPDTGQSNAINKGFEKATGDIFCWINSDDLFMPGALFIMAERYNLDKKAVHFGNCIHFKQKDNGIECFGSDVSYTAKKYTLFNGDFVIQPSSFWSKDAWIRIGKLREDIHFGFDWEWFLRAQSLNISLIPIVECLSLYRIHKDHKSGIGGKKRQAELLEIYKIYSEKFAILYELIINEDLNYSRLDIKIIKKMYFILSKPFNKANSLKLFKPGKYKNYTIPEIEECLGMA